jgi:hypothetical protein
MLQRQFHFTRRLCTLAVLLLPFISAGGCALWNKDMLNPEHYRDPRAVDIDHRLEKAEPFVKNPF